MWSFLESGSGPIDFDSPDDVAKHDKMVTLVERMLDLHQQKAGEGKPNTLKQLEIQITATDHQIDRLVYELYELTDEEIVLVEQPGEEHKGTKQLVRCRFWRYGKKKKTIQKVTK